MRERIREMGSGPRRFGGGALPGPDFTPAPEMGDCFLHWPRPQTSCKRAE